EYSGGCARIINDGERGEKEHGVHLRRAFARANARRPRRSGADGERWHRSRRARRAHREGAAADEAEQRAPRRTLTPRKSAGALPWSAPGLRHNHSAALLGAGAPGRQRKTGFRAAAVSSRRRRGVSRGAAWNAALSFPFAFATRPRITAMKRSSVSLLSVSVGSISIAPCTTSGKYMVMGW